MTHLKEFQITLDTINELLAPASNYELACRADQVCDDLLIIQTMPLDLVLAGFKVSITANHTGWHAAIRSNIGDTPFHALGRGETYISAFASLHKSARNSIRKLMAAAIEAEELETAA